MSKKEGYQRAGIGFNYDHLCNVISIFFCISTAQLILLLRICKINLEKAWIILMNKDVLSGVMYGLGRIALMSIFMMLDTMMGIAKFVRGSFRLTVFVSLFHERSLGSKF